MDNKNDYRKRSYNLVKCQLDHFANIKIDLQNKVESLKSDIMIEKDIMDSIKKNNGSEDRFNNSKEKSTMLFVAYKEASIELKCVSLCIEELTNLLKDIESHLN